MVRRTKAKGMNKALGKCLKKARVDKNWSLEDLRNHMRSPKAKSTLKRYEDGEVDIAVTVVEDVCDALGIDMYYLFNNIDTDGVLKDPDVLYIWLPGTMTNREKREQISHARSMLSDEFLLDYISLSDSHKQMVLELVGMYAAQDKAH